MQALKSLTILLLLTILFPNQQLPAQDIPTQGASFFDAMQEQIGLHYDGKPLALDAHPFEDLLKKLNQHVGLFGAVIPAEVFYYLAPLLLTSRTRLFGGSLGCLFGF